MTDEPRTTPSFSTPEMERLKSEIEVARAELAATVDELSTQLDPRAQATRLAASGRRIVSDATDPGADPATRTRARVVIGTVAGVGVLLVAGLVRKVLR